MKKFVLPLAAAATLLLGTIAWRELTLSQEPAGLLELALRRNVISRTISSLRDDGVSETAAQRAHEQCLVSQWRLIERQQLFRMKDGSYERERFYYRCDASNGVTLFSVVAWKPHLGVDGVSFAVCATASCPPHAELLPQYSQP